MNLLAIETSTEACSVALLVGTGPDRRVLQRHEIAPRRHTELVLPWIDQLLAEAGLAKNQLDAIAVGRGPGAFTGVRLAIALVQGMALALDRPVLPISTLAALALQANAFAEEAGEGGTRIIAAIDARMGEVYLGSFTGDADGLVTACGDETLGAPETVALPDAGNCIGLGTGFSASASVLQARMAARLLRCDAAALPRAADVARLAGRNFAAGLAIAPDRLEPAYLRDKVALTIAEQQQNRSARPGGTR